MPRNATVSGDGFRMYDWPGGDSDLHVKYNATEPRTLLSVTSIRTLNGEPFQLVNWKVGNVVHVAMGTRKVPKIGKRGGILKGKFTVAADGEFPGEFVRRMLETEGQQGALEDVRSWLREAADEPRDIAAVRGTLVHKMIEDNLPLRVVDEDLIRKRFAMQWVEEKRKNPPAVIEDDINFVENGMRQYWDMRDHVPFIIITQEPQVFNLTAGYAGSTDVILWFLGEFSKTEDGEVIFTPLPGWQEMMPRLQKMADEKRLWLQNIEEVGGTLVVGDWKTSASVYTNHVTQITAYLNGEFIGADGEIDERLTEIMLATTYGMVVHIRPDHWSTDIFEFRKDALRAFLGSVAHARFLALHKRPGDLFIYSLSGAAEGTEASEGDDDGE